jgi:exonuclease SbcD
VVIIKLLHTADWHLGKHLEGYSRLEEQKKFINELVDIVEENEVDLVLISGDIYDTFNPPAAAEAGGPGKKYS